MKHPLGTCLWFDGQAKAAAEFYCSVFDNSHITEENPMVVSFELNGRPFIGLNGGPLFKFNESISFIINCDTQEEIDNYWQKLTADGGSESMCGWLKDKFGVSWQVVPSMIGEWMSDPVKGQNVMQVLMKMKKLVIADLEKAYHT